MRARSSSASHDASGEQSEGDRAGGKLTHSPIMEPAFLTFNHGREKQRGKPRTGVDQPAALADNHCMRLWFLCLFLGHRFGTSTEVAGFELRQCTRCGKTQ